MKQFITYAVALLLLFTNGCTPNNYTKKEHQVLLNRDGGTLALEVISDNILHVKYAPGDTLPGRQNLAVRAEPQPVDWDVEQENGLVTVQTNSLTARIDTAGTVSFYDHSGRLLVSEKPNGRAVPEVSSHGISSYAPEQAFEVGNEALYGLGSYQNGLMNWKNVPLRFSHYNQKDAVPFLVSTKGYGLLWDNYSVTYFNPPEQELQFDTVVDSASNIRTTTFTSETTGTYYFAMESISEEGNRYQGPILLTMNQDTVIHYNTIWVPEHLSGRITLEAGKEYSVRFRNSNAPTPGRVFYNSPDYNKTAFKSSYGDRLDYYVVHGKTPDKVIAEYRERELTIGDRPGSFEEMDKTKTFEVVFVEPGKVQGLDSSEADTVITYDG